MGKPTLLYIDTIPGERIQETTLAGIRRYAVGRGWDVEVVSIEESRPGCISALLAARQPVAGIVIECADGRKDLPPRLFGKTPVVYLHAAPSLYGGHGMRVNSDNNAIAAAAFRELSAGCPEAYAVVSFIGLIGMRNWSLTRERAFATFAAESGKPFFHLPWRKETETHRATRLAAWLSSLPRHTAVFAVNDFTASEVAAAAQVCRRTIPQDLTLLGVDNNVRLCEEARPTLSSLQIDHERAGFLAARMLGESAGSGKSPPSAFLASVGPLLAVRRESTRGGGRCEPHILEAVGIIRRMACEGLSVEALARHVPGSRSLLDLRFREAMGHSIYEEILQVRLERVFDLLRQPDIRVGAIADFCGFRTHHALDKLFRSRFKCSMGEWRRRNVSME